ncbi:MAG: hypothetical protein MI749_20680, partial [Desulfovibrionales bacterium]|nr:hypothetical protein [Desulfovibrionales bacterium]
MIKYIWMILGVFLLATTAQAAPVQWSVNGHSYEFVNTGTELTWEAAQAAATGKGGYLATITSQAENTF